MQRDTRAFLWDVLNAANKIERFLHGQTRDAFIGDELLQSAVERQVAIIGEALRQLTRAAPALAQQVADVEQIIGLRNILIHGYATVDSDLIWRSVREDLPALKRTVERLLATG
ncbi:MAG TPA: HepT-like ribonuclease domain-containing protein [Gemmatimonadales bacterium]|nr:HepT-like ribonuclease domain-containing protein [Gemmatimonadales bacterium]